MQRDVRQVDLATGVALSYVAQGDPAETPVVLLHAWAESLRSFDRLTPLLPPSCYTLAVDQRGHGSSGKPFHGYELASLSADVEAFMDCLGLDSAVLVGSSSGGYVAQQVAVSSPERVAGLVLVGSPRTLRGQPPFAGEVNALTDPVDPEWVEHFLTWFPCLHTVPNWYVDERIQDGLRIPAKVWRESLSGFITAQPPTDAGTISCPTLLLWGECDELLSHADQEALRAAIPESQTIAYADTGHLVLWEQPERVAADLSAFLKELTLS